MNRRDTRMHGLVRMICAFALLCLGFAHQPPAGLALAGGSGMGVAGHAVRSEAAHSPGLAADRVASADPALAPLPDGSLPDLCLNAPAAAADGKGHPANHGSGPGCEACRLSAATLLPSPPDTGPVPMVRLPARLLPPRDLAQPRPRLVATASQRGPPISAPIA